MMRVVFRLIKQGVHDFALNPWGYFLALSAVTMVSFLVGIFLVVITTLNYELSTVRGETAFQVYWRNGMDQKLITEQWKNFKHLPGFHGMQTFTPKEALREMEERLGRDNTAKSYPFLAENNPLPATALLSFAPKEQDYERWFKETSKYLRELPGVERISATPLRDELGTALKKANQYVMRPAIIFLTLVMGLIVGNTVRLSLLDKAQEVEILKLVGAFNWYIRLPLVVCGGLIGLLGSAIGLMLLRFIHLQFYDVLNFPPLLMQIRFLNWETIALMLLVPTLTGIAGSWIGLRR